MINFVKKNNLLLLISLLISNFSTGNIIKINNAEVLFKKLEIRSKKLSLIQLSDKPSCIAFLKEYKTPCPADLSVLSYPKFKLTDTIVFLRDCIIDDTMVISNSKFPIYFENVTFKNFVSLDRNIRGIIIQNCDFEGSFSLNLNYDTVVICNSTFKEYVSSQNNIVPDIHMNPFIFLDKNSYYSDVEFSILYPKNIFLRNSTYFKKLIFKIDANALSSKSELNISYCNFKDEVKFSQSDLPSKIFCFHNEFNTIDFSTSYILENQSCDWYTHQNSFSTIKICPQIKISFGNKDSDEFHDSRNEVYLKILTYLKTAGQDRLYKEYDLQYKKFYYLDYKNQRFLYWLQKIWWNFGYAKYLIFIISFVLVIIFSILTYLFASEKLITDTYIIKGISNEYKQYLGEQKGRKLFKKIFLVFCFNIYLFFGVNLSFDKLNFSNVNQVIWILLIYLNGLICTGFIVNYILKV